jgi:hypothetical protein
MRSLAQIENIKSRFSNEVVIENFLSANEIKDLVDLYDSNIELTIKKNTGPVTLDLKNFQNHKTLEKIYKQIEQNIGKYDITSAFFFKTSYPHIIHNDDTYELPDSVYKAITIPLKLYGSNIQENPYLCFFDQCYFHGPAKFFNGDADVPTYYNQQIYNYKNVSDLSITPIGKNVYDQYFTHLRPNWLTGLSLKNALEWIPGRALVFDSVRLHCSSDFRKNGVESKLAISIFTKK